MLSEGGMGPKIVQGLFSIRAGSGSNRTKCGVTCSLRDGCTYLQSRPGRSVSWCSLSISNVKILVALPDGEGSGPWEEFMAEDLGFAWFDNLRNNSNTGFGIRQSWNRRIRATSS